MPIRNPTVITITIASPGGGEQILTTIQEDEDMPQNWQTRTANYTPQNRDRIIADVTAGAWTLTLPPGARYGDEVEVLIDGTNPLTLNPNGAKLNGAAENLAVTSDRARLVIVFKDADRGWIVGTGTTAGSGGGGTEPTPTPTPTPTGTELTYTANGDDKGLFYYLGTVSRTTAWVNPLTAGSIAIASTPLAGGNHASLVNRDESDMWTQGGDPPVVIFDIGATRKLKLTAYTVRSGNSYPNHAPRNWVFEGSNDNAEWTVLDTQSNNQSLAAGNAWFKGNSSVTQNFRYFRFRMTAPNDYGNNAIFLSEFELYGTLT